MSDFTTIPTRSNGDQITAAWFNALKSAGESSIGLRVPYLINNIGLKHITDASTFDTISITGYDQTALSVNNPGYVTLPDVIHHAYMASYSLTSDVEFLLTGAHWGLDTLGDQSGMVLYVYAINDNFSNDKYGISDQPNLRTISNTVASTTQSDIDTTGDMLVNESLTAGTWPCIQIGWFRADFDDTGGASENLWQIQSSNDDIGLGYYPTLPNSKIYALARTGAGQTIETGAGEVVDFGTVLVDRGSNVTTGAAWKFTLPETGWYSVSVVMMYASVAHTAGHNFSMVLYRDGSSLSMLHAHEIEASVTKPVVLSGSCIIYGNRGSYIHVGTAQTSGSDRTLDTTVTNNVISIAYLSGA